MLKELAIRSSRTLRATETVVWMRAPGCKGKGEQVLVRGCPGALESLGLSTSYRELNLDKDRNTLKVNIEESLQLPMDLYSAFNTFLHLGDRFSLLSAYFPGCFFYNFSKFVFICNTTFDTYFFL